MSIAQNLRILNKPIAELAMLPQETIMTMAQSGQIPVAFIAPILAEKAEASQRAVEAEAMMAQQQMPPGSVIEKIIAQNAANETQANMPMMAPPMPEAQGNMPMMDAQMPQPEDVGIGALPVPDEMIPGLAGGGIIAFQNRGLVEGQESNMYQGLGEEAAALRAAKEAFVGPNQSVADLIAYNQEAEKRAAERAKSQFNTRLIEAGLLGLGGDSPYFGVNMGRMAPAVRGMSEDTEKQAEAKEARIKSELAAKGIERRENEAIFTGALTAQQAKIEADRRAKEAGLERTSRESVAALNRKTQLEIANLPPEVVRGAKAIQLPDEKLEDAVNRFADIANTKDQYNAAAGLVKSAFDAGSTRFTDSVAAGGSNYPLALAAGGNEKALKDLKLTKEQANKAIANLRQQYVDEAYAGIGMNPATANRYLRNPRGVPPASKGAAGTEDNPLPMPKSASEAQSGKVYMTGRGLATWNGKEFVPVK